MKKEVNLLWTSGWDSTYWLLEILLVQKRVVQPNYIISRSRQSWELEIQTMDKIRKVLYERYPEAKQRLPTIYKKEIKPDELISGQYRNLVMLGHLGDQHDYLSMYVEEVGVYDYEMCTDTSSLHQKLHLVYNITTGKKKLKPLLQWTAVQIT